MQNFEQIHEIKTPNIDSVLLNTEKNIDSTNEILVEGIPQMEEFCDNHNLAISMFCESKKGFGILIGSEDLIPKAVS